MRISSLKIRKYRTLESIDLDFPSSYTAICGANDSGKTNVVRAIRALMREDDFNPVRLLGEDEDEVSLKNDFPKWLDTEAAKQEVTFEITIVLNRVRDTGFYEFVSSQLSEEARADDWEISITVTHGSTRKQPTVIVKSGEREYGELKAQEILNKLQSSKSILFHNSTEHRLGYRGRNVAGNMREIYGQHEATVSSMKKTLDRGLAKISKLQQSEFENLLGRLQNKYKVGLSCSAFDLGYLPFRMTLGEAKFAVPLDDWGSGTKNRTLILLAIFRARQVADSEPSAAKVTPVIIIEEPESFLHPSAQAELGRILHELAEELGVQVIVTTHSPYLLNVSSPRSNILLRRRTSYKQLRDTERVDTAGEDWMAPFAQALGLDADEFRPWKPLLLNGSDAMLLVEGDTDKEYFTMLTEGAHGSHRLSVPGEIVSYEGTGSLQNTVLLRFVKNRYRKVFVTFDLDASEKLERTLTALQLERGKHYMAIGIDAPGKKNIEGLLPDSVTKAVYGANADLVQAATAGTREEQESAKNRLKKLLLEEFKRVAKPGSEYFGHFYPIVKTINRALE